MHLPKPRQTKAAVRRACSLLSAIAEKSTKHLKNGGGDLPCTSSHKLSRFLCSFNLYLAIPTFFARLRQLELTPRKSKNARGASGASGASVNVKSFIAQSPCCQYRQGRQGSAFNPSLQARSPGPPNAPTESNPGPLTLGERLLSWAGESHQNPES